VCVLQNCKFNVKLLKENKRGKLNSIKLRNFRATAKQLCSIRNLTVHRGYTQGSRGECKTARVFCEGGRRGEDWPLSHHIRPGKTPPESPECRWGQTEKMDQCHRT